MTEQQAAPPTPSQTSVPPAQSAYTHAVNQDYAISMLMEVQKTLGKNEEILIQVRTDLASVKEKTGKIEKVIYAAGVVLLISLAVGAWMLNTAKDFVFLAYKNSLEQPKSPSVPIATPTIPAKKP